MVESTYETPSTYQARFTTQSPGADFSRLHNFVIWSRASLGAFSRCTWAFFWPTLLVFPVAFLLKKDQWFWRKPAETTISPLCILPPGNDDLSSFLVLFWIKVSVHTAMVSILTILLVGYYEWSPWIFLIIPIVAASRLILKRHSWLEVALGVLLPFLFYFIR